MRPGFRAAARGPAARLAGVALAALALLGSGCATGGEGRISLGGTRVDPRWEDLANDLREYARVRFITRDSGRQEDAARALAVHGIPPAEAQSVADLNGHLLDKGLFLSGSSPCSREQCYYVLRLHEVAAEDRFNARVAGAAVGAYRLARLGRRLFVMGGVEQDGRVVPTTLGLPDWEPAQFYRVGRSREEVIMVPYGRLQRLVPPESLEAVVEFIALHEIAHGVLGYREEILADLFALSALAERDVTTARDIADYLGSRRLTHSEGTRTILHQVSLSDQRRRVGFHSAIHQVAQLYIWKGLSEIAGQVNAIDARFPADPRKASDQQVAAMAYALYKQYLAHRNHPGQPCALRDPRLPVCRTAS